MCLWYQSLATIADEQTLKPTGVFVRLEPFDSVASLQNTANLSPYNIFTCNRAEDQAQGVSIKNGRLLAFWEEKSSSVALAKCSNNIGHSLVQRGESQMRYCC
jgi:hypothetical protein